MYNIISPSDWGLPAKDSRRPDELPALQGLSFSDMELRCRSNVYKWLPRHFARKEGAFCGYYDPRRRCFAPPQLVNLIAPWECMAAFDRYGDSSLLDKAIRAAEWLYCSPYVLTHPMSLGIGGLLELETKEAWVKFTAEHVLLNLGLHKRTDHSEIYLDRAVQSGQFLIQAARNHFAAKLLQNGNWSDNGWQAFGRMIEALLSLFETTGVQTWSNYAIACGEHALELQAKDGGFYLINGDLFNSDLAADPLRALFFLLEATKDRRYLEAGCRFADWLLRWQAENGSWPLSIDRDGNVVCPTVGPGDVPNIAIALIKTHQSTKDQRYLDAAARALRYTLSVQVTPTSDYPYKKNPNVRWGFWSWMPQYDFTVSGDQATHHVRGMYFLIDYLEAKAGLSV